MKHAARGLAALSLLGGLGLAPKPAQALSEIQFYVTPRDSFKACILIAGPWFRRSDWVNLGNVVSGDDKPVLVYSAEINDFSPLGFWRISTRPQCNNGEPAQHEDFCVWTTAPVRFTVVAHVIQTGEGFPRCGYRAGSDGYQALGAAYLGDEEGPTQLAAPAAQAATAATAPRPSPLGSDRFRFEGRVGDTIELVLDHDGARGSDGELARLSLRQVNGAALGQREGAVPLELTAKLPAAGRYVIEVAKVAGGPGREPFRGHYHLRFDSASNAEILLEPLDSVEP